MVVLSNWIMAIVAPLNTATNIIALTSKGVNLTQYLNFLTMKLFFKKDERKLE